MFEGTGPDNVQGTWQTLESALKERLSLVEVYLKRTPGLALLVEASPELILGD
jgi:hypothetical protein